MRYWLRNKVPPFERVLIIESGSRDLLEDLLPGLYKIHGESMELDLITCYSGVPEALKPTAKVYRVNDYPGRKGQRELLGILKQRRYNVVGMLCTNQPILLKWKWYLALQLPAKLFILNENGDYFWVDVGHWAVIRHFVLFRLGLAGASAVPALARLLLFPFALLYLVGYAATVHLRRALR